MASVFSFLNYYMTFEFDFIQTFPFSFKYRFVHFRPFEIN